METKNMIGGIVSLAVVVICVAAIMMPVLNDATTTEKTFTNEGYFQMEKYTTENLTITYDGATPAVVEVNGEAVTLPTGSTRPATSIVASDISCLRYNTDGTFQFFSGNSNTSAAADENWTLVAADGSITFTNTTTSATRSAEYEAVYSIANEGDWTMKKNTTSAYMNGESFFMGVGLTAGSSAIGIVGLNVSGTVDDGATITAWRGEGLTFTDVTLVEEELTDYIDLYALEKVTFTATNTDSASLDITYSYFIVPTEVTAELSQHLGTAEISLINAIPVLVIVSLVVAAVGMLVVKNRD